MASFVPKASHGACEGHDLGQAELAALPSDPKNLPAFPAVCRPQTIFARFDVTDFTSFSDGEEQ